MLDLRNATGKIGIWMYERKDGRLNVRNRGMDINMDEEIDRWMDGEVWWPELCMWERVTGGIEVWVQIKMEV